MVWKFFYGVGIFLSHELAMVCFDWCSYYDVTEGYVWMHVKLCEILNLEIIDVGAWVHKQFGYSSIDWNWSVLKH